MFWLSMSATANGPVTLGSDYRTILKSDPILLILKSELDVPIAKVDNFAVTLLLFIGADFLLLEKCVNDLSCDTVFVRCLQLHYYDSSEPILLLEKCVKKKLSCDFSKIGTDLRTGSQISTDFFLFGSEFVFGLKIGSDDRTIDEKIGSDLPILKSCDSRALV